MIKYLLSSLLLVGSTFAIDGESVYKDKCIQCHQMKGMMDMSEMQAIRKKMQNATPQERQTMKKKMQAKMRESGMKAPAMEMVSLRLKKMIGSKEEFVAFVKDYIQNPSQEKGYCMARAYKNFGVMPAIGKDMSAEEREVIAVWLYTNFKGSWDNSADTQACSKRNGAKTDEKTK